MEYGDPVPPCQPNRIVVEVGYPVGTDPPRITEEIQRQESVTTEPVLGLPTGPLVESRRGGIVVRYAPEDR